MLHEKLPFKKRLTIYICFALCGLALVPLAIFHWIDFLNCPGTYVVMPGWIGLIRVLLESSYSWTKQDLFWLAVFTTCFSALFIFGALFLCFNWVDIFTEGGLEMVLIAIPLLIAFICFVAPAFLGTIGITILIPIYILRFASNELVTNILPLWKAIFELLTIVSGYAAIVCLGKYAAS